MTDKERIALFIAQMKERHSDDIDGIDLPSGTLEYVTELLEQGDTDTLMFMLKLGYVMGLQTGFAASQAGQQTPSPQGGAPWGPIEA